MWDRQQIWRSHYRVVNNTTLITNTVTVHGWNEFVITARYIVWWPSARRWLIAQPCVTWQWLALFAEITFLFGPDTDVLREPGRVWYDDIRTHAHVCILVVPTSRFKVIRVMPTIQYLSQKCWRCVQPCLIVHAQAPVSVRPNGVSHCHVTEGLGN